jgi:hypothetical protein
MKNGVECQLRVTLSQIFLRGQNLAVADWQANFTLAFPW